IAAREPARIGRRIAVRLDVGLPTADEQRAQWQAVLGPRGERLNGQLDRVVAHFRLGWPDMQAAGAAIAGELAAADGDDAGAALWDACRRQGRPRLEDLAQRLEPSARWDELVLPDEQRETLREIATHVRHRRQVYDGWGFASRGARGLGISALFAGQSGTGKTMAAEVLAAELELDLYRIDLSQVVSKYIGETEKNLRRIFDAAEQGGAILLFDEADALFGKRAEVKDSHDRYANIEVSYLLQKMEAYRGLAILTTNLKSALDTAFLRRVRFVVHFPFPDAAERGELWRRAFPAATPTSALDADRLARLHLAGGNIRNVALHAAFLAAEADQPVTMGHVLRAARAEYVKLENPFTESELELPPGGRA
ncbi:MAG TPA: ATP-binding protein, partial [Kofleriaceae bacterium]|nr:ATP-binding protein [Kofleriaceae bacterium]